MKRVFSLLLVMMALVGMSGCETANGFGKDLEKLGDKLEETADNIVK